MNTESSSKIAQYLLEAKAVKLSPENPFIWASGWKSPIYCDNRVTLSFPHIRNFIKKELALGIQQQFPNADILVGVATAGIAIGALAADELNLPYAYARPKPKEHGLKNQIEGKIEKNQKIVVIEDLISTGGSSLKVVDFLRENGFEVIGMAAIFSYGFEDANQNFIKSNCPYFTLSNYSVLVEEALKSGFISEDQIQSLASWRANPSKWPQ
jgi:orotate phosphoribosyltransferase